jgi:N-acetylmuramoyl-L-alanine amidase
MKPNVNQTPSLSKQLALIVGAAVVTTISIEAQPDYGPAIWRQAYPGHWYTGGNGHKFCVIHDMEGYYLSTISYFQQSGTQASIHYCANGLKDNSSDAPAGELSQMVREAYYAWHVGCWNTWMFGTEHEGFVSNPAWFTEAMYQASAGLQRHLCDVYGIAKDRNHIIAHGEWQNQGWKNWMAANYPSINTSCNTHTDPGPNWNWSHFMSLIGGTWHTWYAPVAGFAASAPASCSWAPGRMDNFIVGGGNAIWHEWYDGSWHGWESLGGNATSAPAASSWGAGRIDLVTRGTDNNIWINDFDGGHWTGWYMPLPGYASSAPAICSWAPGRLDIFIKGGDNAVWHGWYDGSWHGWESLGGNFTSAPAACSWGSGRIDVVARGTDNNIYLNDFDGGHWTGWYVPIVGYAASDPAVTTRGPGRLDIFVKGGDNGMYHEWFDGSWHGFESLGGAFTSGPGACSYTGGRINVFGRGTDNNIYYNYYE